MTSAAFLAPSPSSSPPPSSSPRLASPLFREKVVARATPESNPRPPPSRSRHREKRNSLFVSPLARPPQATTCAFFCSTGSTPPTPFLSRPSLCNTESISRVFSRASPPNPLPLSPPGGNSFRELCGKFPLLPLLRTSSTSTLFQLPRQLIISFSMNPGDVDIGRLISSVRFIFFYYSLDGQTLPRSILLILRMEFLERIFFRIFMYKERVICWFVLDEFCIYFLFVLGGLG